MRYYNDELYHFGVKGMKWGVRRYQNKNGSLTNAGRARYADIGSGKAKNVRNVHRTNTLLKTASVAAVAGLGLAGAAYLAKNPDKANKLLTKSITTAKSLGKKAADSAIAAAPKVKDIMGKAASKTGKALYESGSRVGKAMLDATLMSVGTIAISKVAEKYASTETMPEQQKYKNQIIRDAASAGIRAATNAPSSGSTSNSSNDSSRADKSAVLSAAAMTVGKPSHKSVDKSSVEYQNLFKTENGNPRDAETRSAIKTLINEGYDIDQIKTLFDIKHSAVNIGRYFDDFLYFLG